MISKLSGIVDEIQGNVITLDVRGVGYEIIASEGVIKRIVEQKEASIIIYTDVKENAIKLYGFSDKLEREVFKMLIQVSGVGAKTGSEILSHIDKNELLRAIGSHDITRLQQVKGIGKKTAERILVELKDKVGGFVSNRTGSLVVEKHVSQPFSEAMDALQVLGLSKREAEAAVSEVQKQGGVTDSAEIVKAALRYI